MSLARFRFGEGGMKARMPAKAAGSALVQNRHHEMLVRSAGLHIIGAEAEGLCRLEAEAGIIARTPYQEKQSVAQVSHRIQTRAHQRRADAASLKGRVNPNGTQSGAMLYAVAVSNGQQAVGSVPDNLVFADGDMGEQQRPIGAQLIHQFGKRFVLKGGCYDSVNRFDVGWRFGAYNNLAERIRSHMLS